MNSAILLIGHGSRDDDAVQEFYQLAQGLRKRIPQHTISTAFLELVTPTIEDSIQQLIEQGITNIQVLPGMLMAGAHAQTDIPAELARQRQKHNIAIAYGAELGLDNNMLLAARSRIDEAEACAHSATPNAKRSDTLLMVVGRGSKDPAVLANFNHITSSLRQSMGFGACAVAYSGISGPSVSACLENAKSRGFKHVMLFPYFLFTGRLVKRLYLEADHFALQHPDMDIVKASYFAAHPKVIDTFVQRLGQIPTNHTSRS